MGRVGVSDLVVELGRGSRAGTAARRLARALRDPSLELGYWIRDPTSTWTWTEAQVSVTPVATRAVTLLERHGRKVAALVHDAALSEDPALLDAVVERSWARARERASPCRAARPARRGQRLASPDRRGRRHRATATRTQPARRRPAAPRHALPPPPDGPGDAAGRPGRAAEAMFERRRRRPEAGARRTPRARPRPAPGRPHRPRTRTGAPIARESLALPGRDHRRSGGPSSRSSRSRPLLRRRRSLTNAAKHADASEARVELSRTTETVVVEIRDNGSGGASLSGGSGIRGLADRIEALGGQFAIESLAAPALSYAQRFRCADASATRQRTSKTPSTSTATS